jgi:hypothetical protein
MSFPRQLRDEHFAHGPFVRQRLLNERVFSEKHVPMNTATEGGRQRRPSRPKLTQDQLFEQTCKNIVEVIAKKNQKLRESSALEPCVRTEVAKVFKQLKDGQLIQNHDIDLATTAAYKQALWEMHGQHLENDLAGFIRKQYPQSTKAASQ